ncbi:MULTISPECIES: Dabb family protein [Paenibacillus]|uniref:Stress responsive alpha/beta barrel protein n=1 Tax=Paenibacillus pabuli TaxID=1472 RepID=A0A855XYD9_9BACL|nr:MULTISPECIES: Dabb family protein [Paenibacillus]PWW38832.1 stress responsive alpha/beta barrel protein [Paenibacillus pabuli]PXW06017.1 stress responsive alpha/beta barrel protein [Paenibacillus taichungensis]
MSSINHLVTFTLYAGKDTAEAEAFLKESADALANIPGVEQFQVLRQVSEKNEFDYSFSMVFANQAAYDAYNDHPVHRKYVEERWEKEVSRFQEIDLIPHGK